MPKRTGTRLAASRFEPVEAHETLALDEHWEGIMLEYTEQDFPTSPPYQRRVPGWKCRHCGHSFGTSGFPPDQCKCGVRWRE